MSNSPSLGGLIPRLGRSLFAHESKQLRALRSEVEELTALIKRLTTKIEDIVSAQKQVGKVLANQKADDRQRQSIRLQVASLIRAQYLPTDIPAPLALNAKRFRLRSQHEEDGIILALLDAAGVRTRRFVEIGSGDSGGSAAVLAHDMGWSGLMVDASSRAVNVARRNLRTNPGVSVAQAFVTPDNINALIHEHGCAGEIDLLSIDVDSVEYWLMRALDACTARVLVLEYNAYFGPTRAVTVPADGLPATRPTEYYGASLAALEQVAREKGYGLVLCEQQGVNAFFVRNDLAPELPRLTAEEAFRPFRHRARPGEEMTTEEEAFATIAKAGLPLVNVITTAP